jgi:uncharacterized membrane protein HdeD (DUF308 family)
MLDDVLARNWGWVALRGAIALFFGLMTLSRPGITLGALILLFGAYAFADGVFTVVSAIANRHGEPHWVALLIGGLFGIAAGIITFTMPHITTVILLYFIAFWAIMSGATEIAAAIRLRKVINDEWLLALVGCLSVLFGIYLLMQPARGALALALWIGLYATILGVGLLILAFRLRSWDKSHHGGMPHPA